ncbi:MAG: tetratricopeptide repeat protein [bacterium]
MIRPLLVAALTLTACGPSAEQIATRQALDRRYLDAERAADTGEADRAFELFATLARDPRADAELRALARHRQGQLRARQGRRDEAIALFESVHDDPSREALAALDRAALHDDRATRRRATLAVAERWPATAAAELALEQLATTATPAEAAPEADALAALAAAHPDAIGAPALWFKAGLELRRLGDLPAARATLRKLTRRHCCAVATHDALWLLGAIYTRQGAYDHAIRAFQSLADTHPDRGLFPPIGSARAIRGDDAALAAGRVALHGKRDPAEAIERLTAALEAFPDARTADDARYALALAHAAAGHPDAARAALDRLLRDHPQSRHARAARAALAGAPLAAPDASTLTDLTP